MSTHFQESESILVIDVEATCWQGANPPGQQNEIIEIGICLLDRATGELLQRACMLVRPDRSTVSPFCTELTTLTQAQLAAEGISFREACERLQTEFRSRERAWASYGDYDRKQFVRQCESSGIPYPFSDQHTNVKARFAEVFGLPRPVGMAGALRHLGLSLEGTQHRGVDDAANIARVFAAIGRRLLAASR